MRLVIDLQSLQGESRHRGIGRQSLALARALIREPRDHEIFVAISNLFPDEIEPLRQEFQSILSSERFIVLDLKGEDPESAREAQLADLNPDVVHLSSLFEGVVDSSITSIKKTKHGYLESVTLHDLMPLIHPEIFITKAAEKDWYLDKCAQLHHADLLLSVSESSRREALDYLKVTKSRIVAISSAADPKFQPRNYSLAEKGYLNAHYGLKQSFIMFTGGDSPQKNIEGLIRAFASLPLKFRKQRQVAIVCGIRSSKKAQLRKLAVELGLTKEDVVFTGYVTDEVLIACYNLCEVFVFPSWHEGFGLPVLEAMCCGAPVIATDATSLPEVVGWTEALFDPHCARSIRNKLQQVLENSSFRSELIERGRLQSQRFSWEKSASLAWDAWEKLLVDKNIKSPYRSTKENRVLNLNPQESSKSLETIIPQPLCAEVVYQTHGKNNFIPYLGLGWSDAERGGVWSDESSAAIFFTVKPAHDDRGILSLKGTGFVCWRQPWNQVRFYANGTHITTAWFFLFMKPRKLEIPLNLANADKGCLLEMQIKYANSPHRLNVGGDTRDLGFYLESLTLKTASKRDLFLKWEEYLRAAKRFLARCWSKCGRIKFLREQLQKRVREKSKMVICAPPFCPDQGSVTVVINTLNRRTDLEETLNSLRLQNFQQLEVVVVNGPSTDGTEDLLEQWKGRIKVGNCSEPNLSMSRNIGIAMASGEFVAFIDDDAIPDTEWLNQIVAGFDKPEVAAVGGKVLNESGLSFQYEYACSDRLGRSNWKLTKACPQFNFPGSYYFPYLQGTNAVFRREVLVKLGGFDEAFAYYLDETELCLRLNDAGFIIRQLPNALVRHKNASSLLRKDNVIKNHTPIIKSKIYFSNVHGQTYFSKKEIDKENAAFIENHRNGVNLLLRKGKMTQAEVNLFEERVLEAGLSGAEAASEPAQYLSKELLEKYHSNFLKLQRNIRL